MAPPAPPLEDCCGLHVRRGAAGKCHMRHWCNTAKRCALIFGRIRAAREICSRRGATRMGNASPRTPRRLGVCLGWLAHPRSLACSKRQPREHLLPFGIRSRSIGRRFRHRSSTCCRCSEYLAPSSYLSLARLSASIETLSHWDTRLCMMMPRRFLAEFLCEWTTGAKLDLRQYSTAGRFLHRKANLQRSKATLP